MAAHTLRYAHEEGYISFGAASPSDELFTSSASAAP